MWLKNILPHRDRFKSSIIIGTIILIITCFLTNTLALEEGTPYQLVMLPTFTEDLGTGTHSMSYNSPYITFLHYVSPDSLSTTTGRYTFKVNPLIPMNTSQQTFTFSVSSQTSQITWAKVIYDWDTTAPDITLQIDTSSLAPASSSNSPVEPTEPYIFELAGRVGFVYGPNNIATYEDRILRVMIYLQFKQTSSTRLLSNYFTGPTTPTNTGQQVYTSKTSTQIVPAIRIGQNELFQFNCGGTILSQGNSCSLGTIVTPPTSTDTTTIPLSTQLKSVTWGSDTSQINITTGLLRIIGPLYTNGLIYIAKGATLIIDVGSTQAVTIFSTTKDPIIVNHGSIHIISGTMRVLGTSIIGQGNVIINKDASLEIDSFGSNITFGLDTSSPPSTVPSNLPNILSTTGMDYNTGNLFLPSIYSEGKLTFISGQHSFTRSIVLLATSYLRIGAGAELVFNNPLTTYPNTKYSTYIIGGLNNGIQDQTNFSAMNELGMICGGSIIIQDKVKIIFGATTKFDGLGRITLKSTSIMTISIPFYTPNGSTSSDNGSSSAGIYLNGPQTERPNSVGILCTNCIINIIKGGLITSSGINTYGNTNINVESNGFLHFTGKYSSNLITGTKLINLGDILILNGSSVDFNIPIDSSTHIRALDSDSTIYFSSKLDFYKFYRPAGTRYTPSLANGNLDTNSSATGSVANNPTHLFALYCAGIVIIRDGVVVQLITDTTTTTSSIQSAKFYTAGLYNSGTLFIDQGVELEVFTYTQSIEPIGLIDITDETLFITNPGTIITGLEPNNIITTGVYKLNYSPNLILLTNTSGIKQIPNSKYIFITSQGVIYDTSSSSSTSITTTPNKALNFNIIHGNVLSGLDITQNTSNNSNNNENYGTFIGSGSIPIGFNVPLTIYPSATFIPGLTIPFQEAILPDGKVVLVIDIKNTEDNAVLMTPSSLKTAMVKNAMKNAQSASSNTPSPYTYTLKTAATISGSIDILNKAKAYSPSISTAYVNSLVGINYTNFNFDLIYAEKTNSIHSDHIKINPTLFSSSNDSGSNNVYQDGDKTFVFENVIINLFTNLHTTLQSIQFTTPIIIKTTNSDNDNDLIPEKSQNIGILGNIGFGSVVNIFVSSNDNTNDNKNNENNDTETDQVDNSSDTSSTTNKIKYPYKPNSQLSQDELILKFQTLQQEQEEENQEEKNNNADPNQKKFQKKFQTASLLDEYFPSSTILSNSRPIINPNDMLLGQSHPNTHLTPEQIKQKDDENHKIMAQIASRSGIISDNQHTVQHTLALSDDNTVRTGNDANNQGTNTNTNTGTTTTNNPDNNTNIADKQQFNLPLIQFLTRTVNSLPPTSTISLSIAAINIFPIQYSDDQVLKYTGTSNGINSNSINGISGGYTLPDGTHKYKENSGKNGSKPLYFGLEFVNGSLNLIGMNDDKASGVVGVQGLLTILSTCIFIALWGLF